MIVFEGKNGDLQSLHGAEVVLYAKSNNVCANFSHSSAKNPFALDFCCTKKKQTKLLTHNIIVNKQKNIE